MDDDKGEGPTGYTWHRGWSSILPSSNGMATVGGIMVPVAFEIHAFRPDGFGGYAFSAVLAYEVEDGALQLRRIHSVTHEVDEALGILRKDHSWQGWKQHALMHLASDGAQAAGGDWDEVQAAIRAAATTPVRRTRNRVTDGVLREVAGVYRLAWESGEPPTQAVAKHFFKSHSTAARWVSLARERGYLGRPDGTRGGEATEVGER